MCGRGPLPTLKKPHLPSTAEKQKLVEPESRWQYHFSILHCPRGERIDPAPACAVLSLHRLSAPKMSIRPSDSMHSSDISRTTMDTNVISPWSPGTNLAGAAQLEGGADDHRHQRTLSTHKRRAIEWWPRSAGQLVGARACCLLVVVVVPRPAATLHQPPQEGCGPVLQGVQHPRLRDMHGDRAPRVPAALGQGPRQ